MINSSPARMSELSRFIFRLDLSPREREDALATISETLHLVLLSLVISSWYRRLRPEQRLTSATERKRGGL